MAIGKVPGTEQLMALMRASLSPGKSRRGASPNGHEPVTSAPPIRQRLAALVQKASPRTPEDWTKLRPVLVQAILVDAFGEDITRHPEFPSFLRNIDDALGNDDGLWISAVRDLRAR
jgi:hypothetical protein